MKYVIIGNSAGGIGCVEGIREIDKTSEILLISNEKYHTYSRPLISYLLLGKTDEQKMKYRADDFYVKNKVKAILDVSVLKIDDKNKLVICDNGEKYFYDKLMVATGSSPFVPPMDGLDSVKNKTTFMSLDDAKNLEAMINKDSRVLIVGAGLIGLKCAEGILSRVKNITVIDLSDKVLSSILDDASSKYVRDFLTKQGINFILQDSVAEFKNNQAILKSGKAVDFDVVVLAVGVRANTHLLKDIGCVVNRGAVVNERMESSVKDVYCAGDVAESYDISANTQRVLAILPLAYIQGNVAGKNMAGETAVFDKAIPMNAIGFFGKHIVTAGSYVGEIYEEKTDEIYKKLFYKDNLLKGYIIIGDISRAGIYTSLIREKIPLDSIDFDLIAKKPTLMAFSRKDREVKLGGKNK